MSNKRNGLLALLGLGALAWWKYKNSTPEEKQAIKETGLIQIFKSDDLSFENGRLEKIEFQKI